jgi:SnoaL-like domain
MDPVQELCDRQAIVDALHLYCRGVDRMDMALLRSIFHPDAVSHHPPYADGPVEEFFASLERSAAETERWTHSLTNTVIALAGDLANAESVFTSIARTRTPDGLQDYLFVGRYLDRFERRNDEWRIAERTVVRDLIRVEPVPDASLDEGARGFEGSRTNRDPVYLFLGDGA